VASERLGESRGCLDRSFEDLPDALFRSTFGCSLDPWAKGSNRRRASGSAFQPLASCQPEHGRGHASVRGPGRAARSSRRGMPGIVQTAPGSDAAIVGQRFRTVLSRGWESGWVTAHEGMQRFSHLDVLFEPPFEFTILHAARSLYKKSDGRYLPRFRGLAGVHENPRGPRIIRSRWCLKSLKQTVGHNAQLNKSDLKARQTPVRDVRSTKGTRLQLETLLQARVEI